MLDCETDKGKIAIEEELKTLDAIDAMGYVVAKTKNNNHPCDAVILIRKEGRLYVHGVAEIKTRQRPLTYEYIVKNGYLITNKKITDGRKHGMILGVPFYIFVRIVGDARLLMWKVTDGDGQYCFRYETKMSSTQATINGGKTIRENAYLPGDRMQVFHIEPEKIRGNGYL